jgi:hypothetical protein
MKKLAILGLLALAITVVMLWQSHYHPGDGQIRRRIVGVWSLDADPSKVIENKSDGSIVVKKSGVEAFRGKWQVKNGYIIAGTVESNKVLRIFGDKMVVLSIDGHTQLTFHRQ